jgi:hypothetical protein
MISSRSQPVRAITACRLCTAAPPAVARPGCRTRHHPAHYHLCGDAGVLDVAFPEAVALAAIRTDLDLRRDIALGWDYRPLYRRISASIGEQRYQAWAYHNAPIRRWIRVHRARFEQLRNGTWRKPPAPQILTPSKRATAQATTEVPAGGTLGLWLPLWW